MKNYILGLMHGMGLIAMWFLIPMTGIQPLYGLGVIATLVSVLFWLSALIRTS